jgi:hypothetical protein
MDDQVLDNPYTLGAITKDANLSDILKNRRRIASVGYEYLAPFELILALEMLREKADREFGVEPENSPYRTRMSRRIAMNLKDKQEVEAMLKQVELPMY